MSKTSLEEKLELALALRKRPRTQMTDEEVLDLYIKFDGNARKAAESIGKRPSNFYARLQQAMRRGLANR